MNSWTSPVDIRPDHLEIVQEILRAHLPAGFKVWVFGSRANWTTKDSSDLDLAVAGAVRLDHKSMIGLEVAFEESDLPYTVDVVDLKAVSSGFRQIVEDQRLSLPLHDQAGKAEWETTSWGDLATLEYGKSLRGYESSEGPYRVYGTNGPIGWCNEPLCFHPSVIIGRKGAYRGVHYSATPFFVIDTAFYLKPKVEIDTRWAYYELLTHDINGMDSGSAIPSTSREDFYGLPVKVPPLSEQRAIAHVLGTLDDKIELNRRMNQTLEEMARAIFQDWFVDFGPTRAKKEGLDPYLPPELWDLFPDQLIDSEVGEIPEGWEVKALEQIIHLNPREPLKKGSVAPYLDMAALPTTGSIPETPVPRAFTSGARFRNGDTLLARITPCLENGKTAFVQSLPEGIAGWGSTEFIVMRPIPPVPQQLTYFLARDCTFRAHAIQSMTGTSGRQRVQAEALASYSLPCPPPDNWAIFGSVVEELFARVKSNAEEITTLTAQRNTLLPKLVSGEVRVGELQTT